MLVPLQPSGSCLRPRGCSEPLGLPTLHLAPAQQQAVFTTVAVPFHFPVSMMCVVVVVAFFSALLSAGLPIRRLLEKRIVSIMRTIV